MKTDTPWIEKILERDGFKNVVHDVAFSPDGSQVLVAVGNRILVYDATDGDLLHSLKGHKDNVYAVAYSKDGKRFASGGADRNIYIWTSQCEGILKYSHESSVQCLTYNPVTHQLASATHHDFGLWSPEQKSVQKYKVEAKVVTASWTNDGQYLALGQMNGHVSIRDRQGKEKLRIERDAPIWTLAWRPNSAFGIAPSGSGGLRGSASTASHASNAVTEPAATTELLAVGCWDQTLSFYKLSGEQHGEDRKLEYDPCALSWYDHGKYLLMGGSDRKVVSCA